MKKITMLVLVFVVALSFARQSPQPLFKGLNGNNNGFTRNGTWSAQSTKFPADTWGIKYIDVVDKDVVWATPYDGSGGNVKSQLFTRTTNGGTNWNVGIINDAEGLVPAMICGVTGDKAYVPMYRDSGNKPQGIYYTEDGGANWTRQESAAFSSSASFPNVVHFFNENDGYCQGDPVDGYFEIYTTTDGGTTWTRVPQENIPAPLTGEWGVLGYADVSGDNVWFGTQKGRVYSSTDKGLTWQVGATSFTSYTDVVFSDAKNGLAMLKDTEKANNGALAKTTDGGLTWTDMTPVGSVFTNDIAYVPGTISTFVSTGAKLDSDDLGGSYSFDGGQTWEVWGDNMENVQMLATDWASSKKGWAGSFTWEGEGGMWVYNGDLVGIEENDALVIPSAVSLEQNYPNPFNPSTTISFSLKCASDVSLSVYDAAGREVANLVNSKMTKGDHKVDFNASHLSAGVYHYSIKANGISLTKKMMLVK
jgi:photosystem II stability/assembly factor-like uncharacterized protein